MAVALAACTGAGVVSPPRSLALDAAVSVKKQVAWVYHDGTFSWPGDYSYPNPGKNIFIDYRDASGRPLTGAYDISVTERDGAFGAWQPYAPNDSFLTAGYTSLVFALKPTVADQIWSCQFLYVDDKPVGISVDVGAYGPAAVPGRWGRYVIPLSKLGVANANIYKFAIQDQTGRKNDRWYIDDVGFAP
jgi:hypothetical protein